MACLHLCVCTVDPFAGRMQLRIGAGPRKTPSASLANYWKERQGSLQFATNFSQRRAEAARKGVAPVTERELHGSLCECEPSAIVFINLSNGHS